jgi:phosphate acyltransferase
MTKLVKAIRVALDGMGGDLGPATVVAGAVDAVLQEPSLHVLLVGDRARLDGELAQHKYPAAQIEVHHAEEEIRMDDHPSVAVRQKRHSSIHVANRLVKSGEAQAVFTAGNTGAAMAVSLLVLGRIPGIVRPALLVDFPSGAPSGKTSLIDVGANVDCKPLMLAQFAIMGEVYYHQVYGIPRPRIGLLSLGEEETKGNDQIHQARDILKHLKLNFVGNIEGQDIVNGRVEVGVCDGFVGNALLKFGTGVAKLIVDSLKTETLSSGILARLTALISFPILRRFFRRLDYSEYGFAPLLGVNGVSAIGHGKSNRKAIKNALLRVARFSTLQITDKIENALRVNRVAAA